MSYVKNKDFEEKHFFSLSEYQKQRTLSLTEKLDIANSLCSHLMTHMKQDSFKYTVHPDEITMDSLGHVSRIIPSAEKINSQSRFNSPEMLQGSLPDERNIVWALGVILFELLTGRVFQASSPHGDASTETHIADSSLPDDIQFLIYRMVEQDADLRLSRLDMVQEEIHRIQSGIVSETPSSTMAVLQTDDDVPHMHNSEDLSIFASKFVGREQELKELRTLLSSDNIRLITVIGLGGIGKSRLAYETGQRLSGHFTDGVYFISLNPVRSPAFIHLAIGNAMGFAFRGRDEAKTQLARHLSTKNMLLILDDFDKLTEGIGTVLDLLHHAQKIRIMITSRERLNIRSERVYELDGLPVPDTDDKNPLSFSSIQLFREHAQRVHPGFDIDIELQGVIRICSSLGGMPLGIELAAGWTRVLSCNEIADEINRDMDFLATKDRDVSERHRGIRATFDRSWRSLGEEEKRGLAQLAIFHSGFQREAARRISDVPLQMLVRFVDKSLIRRDAFGRYKMHELIRQYAERKLSGFSTHTESLLERHARFYGEYLKNLQEGLWGSESQEKITWMEAEFPDIRTAWNYAIDHSLDDVLSHSIDPLHAFFETRGWFHEADRFWQDAEERLRSYGEDTTNHSRMRLYGRVLAKVGHSHGSLGNYARSRDILERARGILETAGTDNDMAYVYSRLGDASSREGRYATAREHLERGLEKSILSGNKPIKAHILDTLGTVFMYTGNYNEARIHHEKGLEIWREIGNERGIAITLNNLGNAYYCQGIHETARSRYEEAAEINRRIGSKQGLRTSLSNIGNIFNVGGQYREARELYEECLTLAIELGDHHAIAHTKYQLSVVADNLNDLNAAEELASESLAMHRESGEKRGQALVMVSLGIIHKRKNDLDAALDYLTQSEALFRQIGARWGIVTALTNLTDVYIIRAEIHQAKTIISKALELAVQIGSDSLTLAALEHASKLIEMKNHREDAYSIYTFILNHEASQFETRKKARDGLKRLTERDGTATTTGQEDVLISSTRATDCSFYVDRVLQILRDEKDA